MQGSDHVADQERLKLDALRAGEGEQLRGQLGTAFGGVEPALGIAAHAVEVVGAAQDQVIGPDDRRQHIVEVMRHAGHELADGFEFLAVQQGFLRIAQFPRARFDPSFERRIEFAQLFLDRGAFDDQPSAFGDLLHEGGIVPLPGARVAVVQIDDGLQAAVADEGDDEYRAGIDRFGVRVEPGVIAEVGVEQIVDDDRLPCLERGDDFWPEGLGGIATQQGRRGPIGPADIIMEDVLDRVELAIAATGNAEMRAHERRDLLQGFLGIAATQHVGNLEAQRDARLPPGDIAEQPFQPGSPQCQQQDQHRYRADQHGEIGLSQISATAGYGQARLCSEDRRAHARIMHAGNRHAHDGGRDQPMRQLMIAGGEPHGSCRSPDGDQNGQQQPKWIIAERCRHVHGCHAEIMHAEHTRADQQPRHCQAHRCHGRPAQHPEAGPSEAQGQRQRQEGERKIIAHHHARHGEGEHGDEMHRPDAAAQRNGGGRHPHKPHPAGGRSHARRKAERRERCEHGDQDRQDNQIHVVGAAHHHGVLVSQADKQRNNMDFHAGPKGPAAATLIFRQISADSA